MDIQEYFQKQIENIDLEDVVTREVRELVKSNIFATIKRLTEQEILNVIKTEIEIIFKKPLKTDDGWGKKAEYPDFENLFKKVFAEKLNDSWNMKEILAKKVEETVKRLFEEKKTDAINKVVSEITSGMKK